MKFILSSPLDLNGNSRDFMIFMYVKTSFHQCSLYRSKNSFLTKLNTSWLSLMPMKSFLSTSHPMSLPCQEQLQTSFGIHYPHDLLGSTSTQRKLDFGCHFIIMNEVVSRFHHFVTQCTCLKSFAFVAWSCKLTKFTSFPSVQNQYKAASTVVTALPNST